MLSLIPYVQVVVALPGSSSLSGGVKGGDNTPNPTA